MPESATLSNGLPLTALGERIRLERVGRRLSLEQVAARAGVSRSMLSAVERGAKVPTVLLGEERSARVILLRKEKQDLARDPSGWERRILSPVLPGVEFEFMRTTIGPGVDAGAFSPHARGAREYVAIESGTLLLTIDGTSHTLRAGDAIYYAGDCVHSFVNPGKKPCVYYLAMDVRGDPGMAGHRIQKE